MLSENVLCLKAIIGQISCLTDFKNLERLDLSFNNLTSLQVPPLHLGRYHDFSVSLFGMDKRLHCELTWVNNFIPGIEVMRQFEVAISFTKQTPNLGWN